MGLYNDEQLLRLKGLELADNGIKYFAQTSLNKISESYRDAFVYQPVKSNNCAAFPWMVAELKKEDAGDAGDAEESYCLSQAANASHTCLVLCERLAELGARDGSPIVALTSIGPQVKVFITYRSETAEDQCYVCSSLTSTYRFPIPPHQLADSFIYLSECLVYGVAMLERCCTPIQLRCIVDHLMFWALRIFKPWVIDCLEHWHKEETKMYEFIYPTKSICLI